MRVACVLRQSPDFQPEHVLWLKRQCDQHLYYTDFVCYSDVDLPCNHVRLKTNWPKWWAKMEIYRDAVAPTLILDLDTVILDKWELKPEHRNRSLALRHPNKYLSMSRMNGGILYLTPELQRKIYNVWTVDPEWIMKEYDDDDQLFLWDTIARDVLWFQDEYLDEFVSYKFHVVNRGIHPDMRFVAFHGQPRPWDIQLPWIPTLREAA